MLEVGVAYGCLLVHASSPLIDAPIELVAQLAPSRGLCHGVVEAP